MNFRLISDLHRRNRRTVSDRRRFQYSNTLRFIATLHAYWFNAIQSRHYDDTGNSGHFMLKYADIART
jgi:hypothetical protein